MVADNMLKLRPGLLVGLSVRVRGGVEYRRKQLSEEEVKREAGISSAEAAAMGKDVKGWDTVRITENKAEHDLAIEMQGKLRYQIARRCITTPFGLLCPMEDAKALDEAIGETRKSAREFNESVNTTRLDIWVARGLIVESDTDAARGIAEEMKQLLDEMKQGIAGLDVEAVKEAEQKAKKLAGMLDEEVAGKVRAAVVEANKARKEIAKQLAKSAEAVIPAMVTVKLDEAQALFLDFTKAAEVVEVVPEETVPLDFARVEPIPELGNEYVYPAPEPEPEPEPEARLEPEVVLDRQEMSQETPQETPNAL